MSKVWATLLVDPTDILTCKALVYTVEEVKLLREKYRIVGCRTSSVFHQGKQKHNHVQLPTHLTWEEVFIGVKHGFLFLKSVSNESDTSVINKKESWNSFIDALCLSDEKLKEQITKRGSSTCALQQSVLSLFPSKSRRSLQIFEDLWLKGYHVTHGTKFGADYLIYDSNPFKTHAKAMILCQDYEVPFTPLSIVSHGRMASMVLKTLVYASVVSDNTEKDTESYSSSKDKVLYFSLNHALLV